MASSESFAHELTWPVLLIRGSEMQSFFPKRSRRKEAGRRLEQAPPTTCSDISSNLQYMLTSALHLPLMLDVDLSKTNPMCLEILALSQYLLEILSCVKVCWLQIENWTTWHSLWVSDPWTSPKSFRKKIHRRYKITLSSCKSNYFRERLPRN